MKFFDLLNNLYPFAPLKKAGDVVLVRHMLRGYEKDHAGAITKNAKTLEQWMRIQDTEKGNRPSRHFFGCKTVVSFCHPHFYEEDGKHARFVGVFRNHSGASPKPLDIKKDLRDLPSALTDKYTEEARPPYGFFDFERVKGFEDLEGRVVIDWHTPRHHSEWVQKFAAKEHEEWEVREILPKGYVRPFPGIENFTLSFADLQKIVNNPDANRAWYGALSSVAGVYTIRYRKELYVGMASGKDGIIGRWKDYAKNGHGGNQGLKKLPADAKYHFKFSVLQTMSLSRKKQVAEMENLWKKKLGSRNWLNHN